jgi:hypothetical protein
VGKKTSKKKKMGKSLSVRAAERTSEAQQQFQTRAWDEEG